MIIQPLHPRVDRRHFWPRAAPWARRPGPGLEPTLASGGWAKAHEGPFPMTPPRGISRSGGRNPLRAPAAVGAGTGVRMCVAFNKNASMSPQKADTRASGKNKAIPATKEPEAFQMSIHCRIFPNLLLERPSTSPTPRCDPLATDVDC